MPRLTITLTKNMYNRILVLSDDKSNSLSNMTNKLIQIGMYHLDEVNNKDTELEKHCQQLTIQTNALVKCISSKLLDFNQKDFESLQKASIEKCNKLSNIHTN